MVSDAHSGRVHALKKQFQGAQWQRCQVHLMRNILGVCPRHCRKTLASRLPSIFTPPDKKTARALAQTLIADYEEKAPRAMDCLEAGLEAALTVIGLPEKYRRRLRTTHLAERVNEEIRRREKIIRVFPNEDSAARLIGAVLAQIHDAWLEGSRYFDMTEYRDFMQEQQTPSATPDHVVALCA